MRYILDANQAKEIDHFSMNELGMPSLVLMERASLKLAERIMKMISLSDSILVISGTGNNGGDGVAAGRILSEAGYDVSIFLLGKEDAASEQLKVQIDIAHKLGIQFVEEPNLEKYEVIIDGIFGIGLSREITGCYADWINKINDASATVIAVDIPSGIDAGSGAIYGVAIKADATVTFGYEKVGLLLFPGYLYAGNIFVEEIGFPKLALVHTKPYIITYDKKDIEEHFPKRMPHSNKGSYGRLLVIAGSKDISGAAYFAAKAGYLMGTGLVKVITHENNRTMLQTNLPEALLGIYEDHREEDYPLEQDLQWASAIVIGPGLSITKGADRLLTQVLTIQDKPVLIDADGLNLLAKHAECFDDNRNLLLPDNFIITPHLKEMSRLIENSVKDIQEDLIGTVYHTKKGATIVLKDARTLVSSGNELYINTSGNHALAKGGSGDVLCGMIGGLLARGMECYEAGKLAVYLHGLTAEEYIKESSDSSMLATDILRMLPKILPFS